MSKKRNKAIPPSAQAGAGQGRAFLESGLGWAQMHAPLGAVHGRQDARVLNGGRSGGELALHGQQRHVHIEIMVMMMLCISFAGGEVGCIRRIQLQIVVMAVVMIMVVRHRIVVMMLRQHSMQDCVLRIFAGTGARRPCQRSE